MMTLKNRKILLLATLVALQSGCFSPTPPAINPFPRSTPSGSRPIDFPPITYPTPVPEDLKSGGPIAATLAPKEIKVWYLSVVPEQEYLLRLDFPQAIGLYYFGENSDVMTDSLNSLMKQKQPGKFEIRFVAKGSSYYLALGNANTSNGVLGTLLQLQNLSAPSPTPQPYPIETPSPTPTPIPTPLTSTPLSEHEGLNPDPSVPIKVLLSETLSTGGGTDSSRKYQLRFSEPLDPDSLNENLCVFARSPLPLSVESSGISGSGLFSSQKGNVLFRLADFQTVWNADKREVVLSFKPGRTLLSDSDPSRQPSHEMSLACGQTPIKDSAGRSRSSGFANENAQNLLTKIYLQQPPQAVALQIQNGEASAQSDLRLRFNRALFIPTQVGSVGGGLSGLPTEAFAALGKISATEAARNYTLTLERNGQTLLNGVNWAALGGSVAFDPFDSENRTVLLKRPPALAEALSGVFAQGSEAKSFPGPFLTDDADGNGESLALELISKGWQKVPLTINLSENLKNASEVAQDLQSKLNTALKELPEYQRAKDASFSIKRETNDVLTFSFDDPSGLYYGFRITKAFLSSSTQPLPNRLQNGDSSETLPAGVLPPLYQGGDLISLSLGESIKAPSGERLTAQQRNLNLVVKP
ncbi:MAG: hypothetical protein AB7I41_07130 [Candidatus Sericytochromatia bacterium]